MSRLMIALAAVLVITAPALAEPVVLWTWRVDMGGGNSYSSYLDVRSVAFELGYTGDLQGAPCALPRIGCAPIPLYRIAPGAVFDFVSYNTPFFSTVVGQITDGNDDRIWAINRFFDAAGNVLHASGTGGPESAIIHRRPDLVGYSIYKIRLKINSFSLSEQQCCGGGGLYYHAVIEWIIYGEQPVATRHATWGSLKSIYR